MTQEELEALTGVEQDILSSKGIIKLVDARIITPQTALGFTSNQLANIDSEWIVKCIEHDIISLDEALALDATQRAEFEDVDSYLAIMNAQLSGLDEDVLEAVADYDADDPTFKASWQKALKFRELLLAATNSVISRESSNSVPLPLTGSQEINIESAKIQSLIANGQLTYNEALNLSFLQRHILESEAFNALMESGIFKARDAIKLKVTEFMNLESAILRELIIQKAIPLENALQLSMEELMDLEAEVAKKTYLAGGEYGLTGGDLSESDMLEKNPHSSETHSKIKKHLEPQMPSVVKSSMFSDTNPDTSEAAHQSIDKKSNKI